MLINALSIYLSWSGNGKDQSATIPYCVMEEQKVR